MARSTTLPVDFYARPTLAVAGDLIGKVLVHRAPEGTTSGRIVEAEAYIGDLDPACHAFKGRTARNAPLYGPPGLAYVYVSYGLHHLLNAVTEQEGFPSAVLIRAIEPLDGLARMHTRRRAASPRSGPIRDADLCRGPGNLTVAMGISTPSHNTRMLTRGVLTVHDDGEAVDGVVWTPRIGVTLGADRYWRCAARDAASVSGVRRWLREGRATPAPLAAGASPRRPR